MGPPVKAKCKHCGNDANADEFRLHYTLRMMVCQKCFSGKISKPEPVKQEEKKPERVLPPGWDAEDEYLEKMSRLRRQENQAQFTRISGSEHVKCTCAQCKYTFKYDPIRKMPNACPYCNGEIPKLRLGNIG